MVDIGRGRRVRSLIRLHEHQDLEIAIALVHAVHSHTRQAKTSGRQQGIGVQFAKNEAGEQARVKIETLLGGALKSARPTHTI